MTSRSLSDRSLSTADSYALLGVADIASAQCLHLSGLGSEIRRMYNLGQAMRATKPDIEPKLIDLSLGNPDLEPPPAVRQALIRILEAGEVGRHRYMDNAGFEDVRAFVASELTRTEGVPLAARNVFLSVGAAGALQIILRLLLDPGDEVIFFAPFFSEYQPYTVNFGAVPVIVQTDDHHLPSRDALRNALTHRTKAVVLNTPNNPSGVVYSEALIASLAEELFIHQKETGRTVHLISDEPYARLLFAPNTQPRVLSLYPYTWLVRSHSKDLGLAGERIGYFAFGPALDLPETLPLLRNSARCLGFVNAPALMQRILPEVFSSSVNVGEYEARVNGFLQVLCEGGISCEQPGGSFFVFPKSPLADCGAFCERLVEAGVLCVPGKGFGKPGYFRASLTQPLSVVLEAARRIVSVARSAQRPGVSIK